jgi:hypothetical protein
LKSISRHGPRIPTAWFESFADQNAATSFFHQPEKRWF